MYLLRVPYLNMYSLRVPFLNKTTRVERLALLPWFGFEHGQAFENGPMSSGQLVVLTAGELVSIMDLLMEVGHFFRRLLQTGTCVTKSLFVAVHELLVDQDRGSMTVQRIDEATQFQLGQQTTDDALNGLLVLALPALQIL